MDDREASKTVFEKEIKLSSDSKVSAGFIIPWAVELRHTPCSFYWLVHGQIKLLLERCSCECLGSFRFRSCFDVPNASSIAVSKLHP